MKEALLWMAAVASVVAVLFAAGVLRLRVEVSADWWRKPLREKLRNVRAKLTVR